MANGNRGKQFETDMLATFRNAGAWAEKIPDKLVNRGPNLPMMSVEGPPDIIALHHGNSYLVECKARSMVHSRAIEFDRLKPHQLESLLQFAVNGGRAYIAVLWYARSNASPETRALMIPVQVWHARLKEGRKKSLNIDDVIDVPGVKRLYWVGRSKQGEGPWTMTSPSSGGTSSQLAFS